MQLTKHHGLGNDFLVRISGDPEPALARAACDRQRGIGADGLLLLDPAPGDDSDAGMVLLNADGSRAEMSGNGIGCLVQAAVLGGHVAGPLVRVRTETGVRTVEIRPSAGPRSHEAVVDMGPAAIDAGLDAGGWAVPPVRAAVRVDVGNPHLVLHLSDGAPADREWLVDVGRKANAEIDGGVNVEVVTAEGAGLHMDVYERGVGLTDACGTGAVAVAAAARRWGLTGDRATVTMHGGPVEVALDGDEATLITTITFVATIDFPWP